MYGYLIIVSNISIYIIAYMTIYYMWIHFVVLGHDLINSVFVDNVPTGIEKFLNFC